MCSLDSRVRAGRDECRLVGCYSAGVRQMSSLCLCLSLSLSVCLSYTVSHSCCCCSLPIHTYTHNAPKSFMKCFNNVFLLTPTLLVRYAKNALSALTSDMRSAPAAAATADLTCFVSHWWTRWAVLRYRRWVSPGQCCCCCWWWWFELCCDDCLLYAVNTSGRLMWCQLVEWQTDSPSVR